MADISESPLGPLRDALRRIVDPCSIATGVPVDLLDMGLVKDLRLDGGTAHVELIVTSPLCTQIGLIVERVREVLKGGAVVCSEGDMHVIPWGLRKWKRGSWVTCRHSASTSPLSMAARISRTAQAAAVSTVVVMSTPSSGATKYRGDQEDRHGARP